ncbi:MAG: hypothetical protein ACAH11_11325 [Sphingomonas sp.]
MAVERGAADPEGKWYERWDWLAIALAVAALAIALSNTGKDDVMPHKLPASSKVTIVELKPGETVEQMCAGYGIPPALCLPVRREGNRVELELDRDPDAD